MVRIAYLGTPAAAVPALRALASARPLAAVFCNPDRPQGRGRHLEPPPVKLAALELGLDVHQPERWRSAAVASRPGLDATEELPPSPASTRALWESLEIDLAVVAAYGHLLPGWMLDSCRLGVWNLHFSLLPRWRGAAPVNHALLAGDPLTGVSLMRLTPGLDEGPVLAVRSRPVAVSDTADTLLEVLAQDAAGLLLEELPALERGSACPMPQMHELATLAPKLHRGMSALDPLRPAAELHRQVRALQPWPGTDLVLHDTLVKVCAVGGLRADGQRPGTLAWSRDGAWLTAGDGQALELTLLQRPGKPIQPAPQALQPWGAAGNLEITPRTA